MRIKPVYRSAARRFVALYHSHHAAHVGDTFSLGGYSGDELVAVCVMGRPIAPRLDDGETWEVTRLCCGPEAPKFAASRLLGAASRLLGAASRVMDAAGITLQVSYTRVDERGSCYLAANWTPVAVIRGRPHDTGNRQGRWLPGMYEPTSEVIDRVRWERGPRAKPREVSFNGTRWQSTGVVPTDEASVADATGREVERPFDDIAAEDDL